MSLTVDEFLAHHGVKGMKWGVRRTDAQLAAAPASDDAKRVHEARTKAKTSGTASLSNKEMQDLVTRLNLQQQYSRLTQKPSPAAITQKKVKGLLALGVSVNAAIAFSKSPAGKLMADAFFDGGGRHDANKSYVSPVAPKHRK